MPKKFLVATLFASIFFSQTIFPNPPQTSVINPMLEMAAMLPDSDIVATFDSDRMLNIAAPDLLGNDAKKIEHLKNLMRTIENQIGLSPYEIKQMAFGIKFPAQAKLDSLDIIEKSDFAAIIRTANPNSNLLDTWSQRVDVISAFKEEQMPSRKYMEDFKVYRDFKLENAAPEKIANLTQKLTAQLTRIQEIDKKLTSLPKLTTDAGAVANLRAKTKEGSTLINKFLAVLKADVDNKALRETSIKILNRWNAVTVDDSQRTAKLLGILTESKNIAPALQKKYENARKIESLLISVEPLPEIENSLYNPDFTKDIDLELDKLISDLNDLPTKKINRTDALIMNASLLETLNKNLQSRLDSLNPEVAAENPESVSETTDKTPTPVKTVTPSFSAVLKTAKSEQTINGKRMIIVDIKKFDAPVNVSEQKSEDQNSKENLPVESKTNPARIAIGFLDERTMVIGFENTITTFLKREANYKNQKVIEMLGNSTNSIMAFAVNSTVVKSLVSSAGKSTEKPAGQEIIGNSTLLNKLTDDINVYGSINYDAAGNLTNDITMSLGFYKEKVAGDSLPATTSASSDPNVDNTFEIAGYQVGKDIFYDLFSSFKAVQASMTFKFEKKKIASLIRSTPRIIDKITTSKKSRKSNTMTAFKRVPNKVESFQELLTVPQFYVELAGLFGKSASR